MALTSPLEELPADSTTAASRRPATRYKWYALGVLMLVSVFNTVDRLSLFILQVGIKKDLGLSDAQLGALTGVAFSLIYTLVSIPVARGADRGVRKTLISVALVVWSIMTACCGFAAGFLSLALLRMGVAIGEAGAVPASHSLISDYFEQNQRATALALWSLSLALGQVLGFGLSGWLGAQIGWRGAFFVLGLTGLCVAPLVFFLKEPKRGLADGVRPPPPSDLSFAQSVKVLWRLRSLRHVYAGAALNCYIVYVVINWNAPFYSRLHHLSMTQLAGALALLAAVGTGLGMIVGGVLADRLGRTDARWRMRVPFIAALGLGPLILLQYFVPDVRLSLAAGVFTFMLGHAFYAPVVACAQSLAPANMRAFTASMTVLSFNLFGMSLGPFVTGLISDFLADRYGMTVDSLRYAIAVSAILAPWAAYHYYRGAQLLPQDLPPTPPRQAG